MSKIYYRCSVCHSKLDFNKKYNIPGEDNAIRCNKCACIIRGYKCQHDYWWERFYFTIREMIRSFRK